MRRAAATDRRHRNIGEKLSAASLHQHIAEQDKHDDDCCADLKRDTKQGIGVEAHIDRELRH